MTSMIITPYLHKPPVHRYNVKLPEFPFLNLGATLHKSPLTIKVDPQPQLSLEMVENIDCQTLPATVLSYNRVAVFCFSPSGLKAVKFAEFNVRLRI